MTTSQRHVKRIVLLMLCVLMSNCASLIQPNISEGFAELKPGNYRIDSTHSTLLFKINHLGFSSYVGRFNNFDAQLEFNPSDLASASLHASVDMASIDINNPALANTLRGSSWLNVAAHPRAYFESESVTLTNERQAIFTGNMTFLGVSQRVDLAIQYNGGGVNILTAAYTIGFAASTTFKRSNFGLTDYIPAIGDSIELEIHAEFKRQR